ncbi:MAG: hypothetical protein ABI837_06545 [Acidobacteriota bacterium]
MRVSRTAAAAFTIEFESEAELREEHRTNLSIGALRVPTSESVALNAMILLTLRGPGGGEAFASATVVMALPDSIALALNGNADEILARLLAGTTTGETGANDALQPHDEAPLPTEGEATAAEEDASPTSDNTPEKRQNAWDVVRSLSQIEKILLAVKAERTERALLLADSDPRVLLSLLRNPRLTADEVTRLAKSSSLNFQIADVIMKAGQWMGSLDVRLALIQNAKTPPAFALRILPTLPDAEVKAIARGGTSMALKQAALRRLQGKA